MNDTDLLRDLYEATAGDSWKRSDNWLSNMSVSTWYGVTTDNDDQITGLNLAANNLNGTIPTSLFNITTLESISLAVNSLQGIVVCMPT